VEGLNVSAKCAAKTCMILLTVSQEKRDLC